jgi:hypothetical protein
MEELVIGDDGFITTSHQPPIERPSEHPTNLIGVQNEVVRPYLATQEAVTVKPASHAKKHMNEVKEHKELKEKIVVIPNWIFYDCANKDITELICDECPDLEELICSRNNIKKLEFFFHWVYTKKDNTVYNQFSSRRSIP